MMKWMVRAEYTDPGSVEELLSVLHQHGGEAKVIAGGTDLVPQMRLGKLAPRLLVDPIHLPLGGITKSNGDVVVGARITHTQVLNSPLLKQTHPSLVEACRQVGGPPVRNRGTLAGNLANASPAADSALPLLAYDAQILAMSIRGERWVPLNEFFMGPGRTCLAEDEFIHSIKVSRPTSSTHAVFLKLGTRKAMAIAVASVGVRLSMDEDGKVKQARIALGSVAPTPFRATQAEAILEGNSLDPEIILQAAQLTQQAADPISDVRASAGYRSRMVFVLMRRSLELLKNEWAQKTLGQD